MKKTMERLWNEYFAEACAVIHTEEERALIKQVADRQERAYARLTREQSEGIEAYMEAVHELQDCFIKKAFFRGCEFAAAFLLEVGTFGKR